MIKKVTTKIKVLGLIALCLAGASLSAARNKGVSMTQPSTITLYYSPSCPYCHKVIDYMDENCITLNKKNTQDPKNREELIKIGGKPQVPCLVHNGKALYESSDIIKWLEQHKKELQNGPCHD